MNILAFDTCFDACSVGAGRQLRSLTPSIAVAYEAMAVGHAERLMPMIEEVMADAGLSFGHLNRIAVTTGPGTFTGTRIAVSAARALSLATGAPVVTLSSLHLMAMNPVVPSGRGRHIAIATDARRDEVYFQKIDRHSLQPVTAPALVNIHNAASALGAGPIVVAGSGAEKLVAHARDQGVDAQAILPNLLPDAFDVLFAAYEFELSGAVEPLYLRPPDAKPPAPGPIVGAGQ